MNPDMDSDMDPDNMFPILEYLFQDGQNNDNLQCPEIEEHVMDRFLANASFYLRIFAQNNFQSIPHLVMSDDLADLLNYLRVFLNQHMDIKHDHIVRNIKKIIFKDILDDQKEELKDEKQMEEIKHSALQERAKILESVAKESKLHAKMTKLESDLCKSNLDLQRVQEALNSALCRIKYLEVNLGDKQGEIINLTQKLQEQKSKTEALHMELTQLTANREKCSNYPTASSAPHSLINGFKRLLAIAVETDYTFKEAERTKEFLKDPLKFAAVADTIAPASAANLAQKEEKKRLEELIMEKDKLAKIEKLLAKERCRVLTFDDVIKKQREQISLKNIEITELRERMDGLVDIILGRKMLSTVNVDKVRQKDGYQHVLKASSQQQTLGAKTNIKQGERKSLRGRYNFHRTRDYTGNIDNSWRQANKVNSTVILDSVHHSKDKNKFHVKVQKTNLVSKVEKPYKNIIRDETSRTSAQNKTQYVSNHKEFVIPITDSEVKHAAKEKKKNNLDRRDNTDFKHYQGSSSNCNLSRQFDGSQYFGSQDFQKYGRNNGMKNFQSCDNSFSRKQHKQSGRYFYQKRNDNDNYVNFSQQRPKVINKQGDNKKNRVSNTTACSTCGFERVSRCH